MCYLNAKYQGCLFFSSRAKNSKIIQEGNHIIFACKLNVLKEELIDNLF